MYGGKVMSITEEKKDGVVKNQYYSITKEDIENGKILEYFLKDGKILFALRYGENEDSIATIALATVDMKFTKRDTLKELLGRIEALLLDPGLAALKKFMSEYEETGLMLTNEGEIILSEPVTDEKSEIPATVYYNPETCRLEEVENEKTVNLKTEKIEKIADTRKTKLKKLEEKLRKLSKEQLNQFKRGKDAIFKVMTINSLTMPETGEEAVKILDILNSMEEFNENEVIKRIKKSAMINEMLKMDSEIKERSNDENQEKELKKNMNRYAEIVFKLKREYAEKEEPEIILNLPEDDSGKALEILESIKIKDKEKIKEQIRIFLPVLDTMKSEFYEKNEKDIKWYCEIMEEFDVVYELAPIKNENRTRPKGGIEPGE